jgi:type I restriction-modification system DNA methylase subunit
LEKRKQSIVKQLYEIAVRIYWDALRKLSSETASFVNRVKKAYEEFYKSVTVGKEHDVRARFIRHVIIDGLGYPEDCYLNEKDWADIWLLDRKPVGGPTRRDKDVSRLRILPTVIIETKDFDLPNDKLASRENLSQVFGYALKTRAATRYVGLTNFKRLMIWRFESPYDLDHPSKPIADVNLEAELRHSVFSSRLQELVRIGYEEILKTYDDFAVSANIDLANDENFNLFSAIVKWKILDENLIPVFRSLAGKLFEEYQSYLDKSKRLEYLKQIAKSGGDAKISVADIDRQMRLLESSYEAAITFASNYDRWEHTVYSPSSTAKKEERLDRFARETAYTLLSRLLLVRIAESKNLLRQKLSDGGLISALNLITQVNEAFKHLLHLAFSDARYIYEHLFLDGLYDWYWQKNGELNAAIKKCLWFLNQYDFSNVRRDVFKHVYQHHMDSEERKKIGEYYTPDEVVCYILDKVSFESSRDLRQVKLIDPACGSGTFLVEAINRAKESASSLSPKEVIFMVAGRKSGDTREKGNIFGFDIMPFAVYLCESNLLFQLIKEITAVKVKEPHFNLDKFQVYRTNSLLPPSAEEKMDAFIADVETGETETIRRMKFRCVVGNPPYVEVENLRDKKAEMIRDLKTMHPELKKKIIGRLELYIAFLARSILWLEEGGKLGFIVPAKFLSTQNGQWLRELILDQCVIEEIVDLMRVQVFKQDVYPLILILRKESNEAIRNANDITVKIVSVDDLSLLKEVENQEAVNAPEYKASQKFMCYKIPQSWFKSNPRSIFEINSSSTLKQIRDRMTDSTTTLPLQAVMDIRQGVIAGGNRRWEDRLKKLGLPEYGENFTVEEKDLPNVPASDRVFLKKLVNGGSVGEFVSNWKSHPLYIVYDKDHLTAPREESVFEQKEKLILMAKPRYLQASLDYDSTYVTNDTYVARWRENPEYKPDIKYLLGLMNSKVLDLFYKIRHCEYVRGGWFVRYGIFFDELPIKKADANEEKEIVAIVDQLIDARTKTLDHEQILTSFASMVNASNVATVTAGLSTIVDLKSRKGGNELVESLSLHDRTVYFNKQKTASIRCVSENAARFVFELMKESFETLKNRTLDEVMSLAKLPADHDGLQRVEGYIKQKKQGITKLDKKIEQLKQKLDEKVAEIYGLQGQIGVIRNALRTISGEVQEETL